MARCASGGGQGATDSLDAPGSAVARNVALSRRLLHEAFAELEAQCREERAHYERTGLSPPPQSGGRWAAYLSRERVQACEAQLLDFVRAHPECRARTLLPDQLRFLLLVQHRVTEDTSDFYRPLAERRHNDKFEGVLTEEGVNSQLVKDAHRSDWSVDGHSFSMQHEDRDTANGSADRRRQIAEFQRQLVTALEACVLGFGTRRGLSTLATQRLLQAVTTQMSQCGLANLDRSSQAAGYFVSGLGLEQRTAYSLSTAEAEGLGEVLQLSLCCLKTGFAHFQTEEGLAAMANGEEGPEGDGGPCPCAPSSYLYQYATLRFAPGVHGGAPEQIECTVLDALDEVHILPPCVDGWQPL